MEVNYVDQYIHRRNQGEALSSHAAVDKAVKSVSGVKSFVDRTDSLHLQLATFEDKMLNLTKLVKLSQTLAEEKEADLRKENHDLKVRIRRQEQLTSKLGSEVKHVENQMPHVVREGLQTTSGQLQAEISQVTRAVNETNRAAEERNADMRQQMVESIIGKTESMMNERLHELECDSITRLKEAASEHSHALGAIQNRFDLLEKQTLEQYRRQAEEQCNMMTNTMRDAIMAEVRSCVRAVNDDMHEELTQLRGNLQKVEDRCGSLEGALSEFIKSYRENTIAQSTKIDETGQGVKELVTLQEQTRSVVGGELERTKEWATRNLHRLKKHVDTLNADIQALKESHVDMTTTIERLRHQHSDERERLSAMLQTKSKEAAVLTQMVDNEIVGIQNITHSQRHSPVSSQGQPLGAATSSATTVASRRTEGLGGMAFSQPKAEAPPSSMFDELSFSRQRQTSPGRRHTSPVV